MNGTTVTSPPTTIHKFERAGLGKAPFRCVGFHVSKYVACPGAPIQPGTSCDYCGTGIMNVYTIRSADGRMFKVGCDCVLKVGDAGLTRTVNAYKAEAKKTRDEARIAEGIAKLADARIRAALQAQPHPLPWRADKGETLLDQVEWYLENAGTTGKTKVVRIIEATAAVTLAA